MNSPGLPDLLAALSPLLSYFLGRGNRAAGALASAALLAGSVYAGLGSGFGPAYAALLAWALAALAHSVSVNSPEPAAAGPDPRLAELEARLVALKKEFAALGEGEKKAQAVYSAVKLLSEAVDLSGAGGQFARHIKDYFGTQDFAFYVYDAGTSVPELFSSLDKTRICSWAGLSGLAGSDPAGLASAAVVEKERLVMAPVSHAGSSVGLLALRFPERSGGWDAACASAAAFADEVSFAVKRIQLFRQVEWLSMVDGLTGVNRRNALDEKMIEELRRAGAFRTSLGFMIADIDHFKGINDRYGHQFGDFVLKRIGLLLRTSVYETDFVGRYGGEEFGIILPRADFAGVLRKAEAIRTRIESEVFSQGFEAVRVTVSIGIAHFPRDVALSPAAYGNRGWEQAAAGELLARADAALYRAKETGRNRVVDAGGL